MDTRAPDPAISAALDRAAARYAGAGRFARHYVASKMRRDPVHSDILALATSEHFGQVVDIGCGRAQLAIALLEAGCADRVVGLDWNAVHLAQAAMAAGDLALELRHADVGRTPQIPEADTIILVDVLYQLETAAQAALLAACAACARKRVLVRTADPRRGLRSRFTRVAELLGRRAWPHSAAVVNARPLDELTSILNRAGFAVTEAPCWRGTPFANVLLVARRLSPTGPSRSADSTLV